MTIEERFYNIGRLDDLSRDDSPVHRLDARVKIILTLVFIVLVTSYDRYALGRLLPFAAFPVLFSAAAGLPSLFILKVLLVTSPFAVLVGIFNPVLDREIILVAGNLAVSGGWISFISIITRFMLCMSAALILVATTGFYKICASLMRLKVPAVLTVQLMLLYRYLFLLVEEAIRLLRARRLRSFNRKGSGIESTGALLSSLLTRTLTRATRIHDAMRARGFNLDLPLSTAGRMRLSDFVVLLSVLPALSALRVFDLSGSLGSMITGGAG